MPERNMADQILTPQRLINGDKDLQTIEDFMKIKDETITTRFGDEIMTMNGLQEEVKKSGGYFKRYTSLSAANADIANIPLDAVVKVTSAANGGDYEKAAAGATSLTKSPYDPVEAAKLDATTKANAAKSEAIIAAATDATTKANAAEANAKNYTSQKIQSAIRSDQSNLKDQAAFAFTDSRGVRTWLEATEEGSPTEYARTSMFKSSGALIGIISNYSTGNAVTFVDSADRILGILNGDESASKEISSTSVDLSTWAFFGSSSMMYLQDDVFALLQNNFDQVRNAKYYGTSASRMQHTLANIGVNKASLSFVDGVIDNTARTVTPAGFEFGVPTIHTVNGQLENGIKGTYKDSTFTAASGSLTVSATTPIKFISDGSTHRNAVALVNIGKNNVAATGADVDVLAGTRAAVEYLDERNDRHTIVLGHFVNTDQTEIGKANIISLNNSLRSIYYDRFIDIQAYLMGDQVWSDVGLTKTQADIDAIAAGVLPPSLGRNNAHLSAAVDAKLAEKILNLVISKGWYA